MYLDGPGVLLDASALDSLLAFSKSEPMAAFPATAERKDLSTSLLMIHPSQQTFSQLRALRTEKDMTDLAMLRETFTAPESLMSEWSLSMGNVVYDSSSLRKTTGSFNATAFEQSTTLVRLADPDMPGPEYDVPFADRVKLRPENAEAEETWTKLYEMFRQRRMEVCGLDLEPVEEPATQVGIGWRWGSEAGGG